MMSDRIFAGIWSLLCIVGLFVVWRVNSEHNYEPVGLHPFPPGIIGLMLVRTVALLLRHPNTISWSRRHVLQKLLMMVIVLLIYAQGSEWLGFPIATAIPTMVVGMLFGATTPVADISGTVFDTLLWFASNRLLDITLPLDAWLD